MKPLLIIAVFLLITFGLRAQQSISLPTKVPTHCTAGQPCTVLIWPNTTQILIAKESWFGAVTDTLGITWIRDNCTGYEKDCIFHAHFSAPYPIGDTLTFPDGGYQDAYVLQYEGIWNFTIGQVGDYANQNAPFPDCINGQGCPYDWTLPVETEAGNLLIAYSNPLSSGPGLPKPGFGFNIEANDGFLAVEDMIASTEGVYIGSLIWKMSDGSSGGGSHWLMGIGVYSRVK